MREGFPCAFMISNHIDEAVLTIFYSKIKSLTGQLQPNVFMSDMAESFFNAWIVEMKHPKHRLYCTWHVDRAWRKNLIKIKSKDKQCETYKLLRTLLHEPDTIKPLKEFLKKL
ncbi:MULE domain-containing protein [Aphis craccivora]|uniref:MULE domain-containing protein n=1 Tax=Aphis craccivora TaxID=307492 RepID=A0A6G0YTS6_APHCR|nr:MULE domain-containing protein [Aphis craccivora]